MANFESFSEDLIPRIVPQPMLHPVLDMSKPTVPEVSLIFNDKQSPLSIETKPNSYKEWKHQQQKQQQWPKPEPITKIQSNQMMQSNDRKKIVTFDLPKNVQPDKMLIPQPVESTPMAICQQLDLSLCEPRKMDNSGRHSIPTNYVTEMKHNQHEYNGFVRHQYDKGMQMSVPMPVASKIGDEQLYERTPMQQSSNQVNLNQKLPSTGEITLNEIYQLLQNMQMNSQSSAATSNKQMNRLHEQNNELDNHVAINRMPLVSGRSESSSNGHHTANSIEPAMKDMLQIIMRQQEQLMNIQNQVHMLLMRTANTPTNQLNDQPHNNYQITDTNDNANKIEAQTKPVGVMTSFEINVQNYKTNAIRADDKHSTENASHSKNALDTQPNFKPCGCQCNCNVNKNSQSSNSDSVDGNLDTSQNHGDTQTGWTFYGNILNQVNDVLHNTSPVSNAKSNEHQKAIATNIENCNGSPTDPMSRPNGRPNIRTAQFKQVGFQIDDVNISAMAKRITFGSSTAEIPRTSADRITSTDNSMLMNALAMKYLPCNLNNPQTPRAIQNGITQTTTTNYRAASTSAPTINANNSTNPMNNFDGKHMNTDMSITSYRYMEKYGLL